MVFDRITKNGRGQPCVRDTRVKVSMVIGAIADGRTIDNILAAHEYLEREDVVQALRYGAMLVVREAMQEARPDLDSSNPFGVGVTTEQFVEWLRKDRERE